MKRLVLWMMVPVLAIGFTACGVGKKPAELQQSSLAGDEGEAVDIRKTVYDQMEPKDRDRMKGGWADARVTSVILTEGMAVKSDPSYIGKEVYVVDYRVRTVSLPDNMIFYVSKSDGKVIGIGIVD